MAMEKEYWLVVAIALFVLSSVLESFAGPVQLGTIANPFAFLSQNYLSTYPLTAAAIGVRVLALFISALLAVSLIEKQYLLRAAILLAAGVVAEAYAVQQLATGMEFTPIQLTLSFAYAGVTLIPAILYYFLKGVVEDLRARLSGEPKDEEGKEESQKRIERIKGLNP